MASANFRNYRNFEANDLSLSLFSLRMGRFLDEEGKEAQLIVLGIFVIRSSRLESFERIRSDRGKYFVPDVHMLRGCVKSANK